MSPRTRKLEMKFGIRTASVDAFAFLFVFLVQVLSQNLKIPFYLIEPMRLALILAILHTLRLNAYVLAVSLPLFSYLISGHPALFKTLLICAEFSLNVWLFFFLLGRRAGGFLAAFGSIAASKLVYYLVKYGLISLALIEGSLFSTPLWVQLITTLLFSGYAFLVLRPRTK